jgi:hypothetical protein
MLLQIPPVMPAEHYAIGSLNLILFIVFAALLFIFGITFFKRAKLQEIEMARRIKYSLGLFMIFYGICRVLFILMFHIDPDNNYNLIASIAYSFGNAGFTAVIWALEKAKYKTKFFFLIALAITVITIIGTIGELLQLANVREVLLQIITLGMPVAGFFIVILYISLVRLSAGVVRKKSIYALIGFLIFILGIFLDGQTILGIQASLEPAAAAVFNFFTMNIVPLICIGGILLFAIPQL